MQYHAVQSNTITLPEAERTQGIESVTASTPSALTQRGQRTLPEAL